MHSRIKGKEINMSKKVLISTLISVLLLVASLPTIAGISAVYTHTRGEEEK